MRTINTTNGPAEVPRGTRSHINTSDILEPPLMTYEDEAPDILAVLPAGDWCAVVGGVAVPVVAFVALDSGKIHGVAIGEDGRINLTTGNVEELDGFTGYTQTTNDKER